MIKNISVYLLLELKTAEHTEHIILCTHSLHIVLYKSAQEDIPMESKVTALECDLE